MIDRAIDFLNLKAIEQAYIDELSGGQKQRARSDHHGQQADRFLRSTCCHRAGDISHGQTNLFTLVRFHDFIFCNSLFIFALKITAFQSHLCDWKSNRTDKPSTKKSGK